MSNPYESRFWKKNWDDHVKDFDPKDFEITYPELIKDAFIEYPDKMAIEYLGVKITFKEVENHKIFIY